MLIVSCCRGNPRLVLDGRLELLDLVDTLGEALLPLGGLLGRGRLGVLAALDWCGAER
jgi:hypothetical protein